MRLSDSDKREVCALHGWVGRRDFQQGRHELCEAPPDLPEVEEAAAVVVEEAEVDEAVEVRGGRSSARRRGIPSKKTLAVRRITQVELEAGRAELRALGGDEPYARPKTRGDCQWCAVCQLARDEGSAAQGLLACGHQITEVLYRSRPCVFAACKYSLYLDVSETGSIILNFPHLEPGQMPADRSCALDLSERGSMTLEEVAVVTNLTRERIRQVELKALRRRARPAAIAMGLGSDDAAAIGGGHHVGPSADLEETGVEGAVPSDVATILTGSSWDS
jgi:hypothetical protein